MDDSVGRESSDHKGDSYQKHCNKVVTKLSGCCIDENRKKPPVMRRRFGIILSRKYYSSSCSAS